MAAGDFFAPPPPKKANDVVFSYHMRVCVHFYYMRKINIEIEDSEIDEDASFAFKQKPSRGRFAVTIDMRSKIHVM